MQEIGSEEPAALYGPLNLPYKHTSYNGIPIPAYISNARLEELKDVSLSRPDDVYIATCAKSGTTWLMNVVYEILGRLQGDYDNISNAVPWIEQQPREVIAELKSPRLFKTHLDWNMVPKGDGVRYISCYRNPKDVAASYYFHMKNFSKFYQCNSSFEEYMERVFLPKTGKEFGNYFDFVSNWLSQRENPNVLFLTYEDMVEDLSREVKRIAAFLNIPLDKQHVEEISAGGQFDAMKSSTKFNYHWRIGEESKFMRKGKVGDWVNHLSEEHSKKIECLVEKHLKSLGAKIRYNLDE